MTLLKHILAVLVTILCMSDINILTEASRRELNLDKQDIIDLFKNIGKGIEVVLPGEQAQSLKKYHKGGSQRKSNTKQKKFSNVKFVKRVIPHGQVSLKEEYDPVQKTLYRPLFVIHQREEIPQKYNRNFLEYIADAIKDGDRESDDTLLQPFKYTPNEDQSTNKKVTKQFKKNKKTCNCQKKKNCPHKKNNKNFRPRAKIAKYKKQKSKTFYRDLWDSFKKSLKNAGLRTAYDKSGEEPQTMTELVSKYAADSVEQPPKKKSYPYYPFWNWWVYKETVYHDECEDYQVKVGGICIKVPEH